MNIQLLDKISYGLYIISSHFNGKDNGFIGNAISQITADPAVIMVSTNNDNFTTSLIRSSGNLAITIMGQNITRDIISKFGYKSGKDIDKYEGIELVRSPLGLPLIKENMIGWIEAKVFKEIIISTHTVFFCNIEDAQFLNEQEEVLTYKYYKEVLKLKAPKTAPTYNIGNLKK